MQASRAQRLAEFLRRLGASPAVPTAAAALDLIGATLNSVEDEMTTIPYDPDAWPTDGRMYPPRADARRDVAGRPDVARYRSRAHNTYVRSNGAFEVQGTSGEVLVSRPGLDGRGVWS
jgi:hypothetical protein